LHPTGYAIHADGHPCGKTFSDIIVMPGRPNAQFVTLVNGGPIWPDFEDQTWVRHMRRQAPVDVRPDDPAGPVAIAEGPFVWGGIIYQQFGHLCSENSTRILWSLNRWPDATFLFIGPDGDDASLLPEYYWTVFEWLGLRRNRVRIVTEPLRAGVLHVMPQAERLPGPPPPQDYLDLLDARVRQNGVKPIASDILYVSRVGLLAKGSGANAGEVYLQSLLSRAGVTIMDPATIPLHEQIARYIGAKVIVFAEGAAVHGRQLVGRVDQTIHVLNRRPINVLGQTSLKARTRNTHFVKATRSIAKFVTADGRNNLHHGLSFYDLPVLFNAFSGMGIDLSSQWDDADYRAARDADATLWLKSRDAGLSEILWNETLAEIGPVFEGEGITHLLPNREEA
jgi:hypothetical protein